MSPYRDGFQARRRRIEFGFEEQIERDGRVTDELQMSLPKPLRSALLAMRKKLRVPKVRDADSAGEAEVALEACRSVLDEVYRLAPELERAHNALPTDVDTNGIMPAPSRIIYSSSLEYEYELLDILPGHVERLDPSAEIVVDRQRAIVTASFGRRQGVPFFLATGLDTQRGGSVITIATGVRRSTPNLKLRPQLFGHAFSKAVGLTRDIEVGDAELDGRFLIDAEQEDARRMLTASVRRDVLRIAAFDEPVLVVGAGRASLNWRYDLTYPPLEAALRILTAMRSYDVPVALLRKSRSQG